MSLYSYISGFFIAFVSYIVYVKYVNIYSSVIVKPQKRYDYIIVGAGTAGCVLASRLSEDPTVTVLLIEAGDYMGYFTRIPLTPTAAQQGPNDWSVRTVPQKYSSFGLWKQTQIIPRGKGLGGSGQINFLLHGFGLPEDYERWSRMGFKGWSLEDLKPYFIKGFGTVRSEFDSEHCSLDGVCPGSKVPMKLKLIDDQNELMRTFRTATYELRSEHTIFRTATATVKDGVRHLTFDAYLKSALNRKNLHVLTNTQAVSIRFENRTASSVFILQNHRQLYNIFINKEIILAAGAIKSPQLLMLSGIGPRDTLQRLRIKVVSENEHVGRNLHDHMNMPIFVSIKKPISVTLSKIFTIDTVWSYFWKNQGLLSFPPVAGVEYQNTSAVMLFSMGTASERLLRDLSNYKPKVFRDTFPFHNDTRKEGFIFLGTCVQPRSRGTVDVKDVSTTVPPVVDPNYLHQYYDIKCMIKAMRRIEEMVSTRAFQEIGARIHWPRVERCLTFWNYTKQEQFGSIFRRKKFKFLTNKSKNQESLIIKENKDKKIKMQSPPDEYLECIIREVAVTGHHVGGTCAGGRVVDDELRVKSVKGVRIMDASVLPSPISLYPNSVLVAMAEKAVDIIKKSNV
ncbi:neither inactivation nor afterpotential protein G [Achroia grisella]|uniref:neither inactivation nor afterpotential protein G n=1 Tax=Achroia grisella TaxID=688607 RepID=UPI0027D28FE8|nr:neither inactivation nor afterpotential protein G [Achroia grisella]